VNGGDRPPPHPRSLFTAVPGHQFHRPARCMKAGTSTIRMMVASSSTATARPKPRNCITSTRAKAKIPKTRIMMSAADVMTDAVALRPSSTASSLCPVRSNASFIRLNRNTS